MRLYLISTVVNRDIIASQEHNCTHLGEVIGGEGDWYTWLFISNANLTQDALNDMKNLAHAMGADTVIVYRNIGFATSVTLLGQAYDRTRPQFKT